MGDAQDYSGNDHYGSYGGASQELDFTRNQSNNNAPGFDDQFNDGILHNSLSVASRARPNQWPASASEMGRRVELQNGGMSSDHDSRIVRAAIVTSGLVRPDMFPKSSSEMRGYVDFQEGQKSEDINSSHLRLAGRQTQAPPSRYGWVFSLREQRWVKS